MKKNIPDPQKLGRLLAECGLKMEQKKEILNQIPFLSDQKLIDLYESLQKLTKQENEFISDMHKLELSFQLQAEKMLKDRDKK